jgi:SAM-dependent methyltransferase
MAGGARAGARSAVAYVTRPARMAHRRGFMRLRNISPRDTMFRWHERDHYFSVGRSARECIRASMRAAHKADAARILDFGCGYGRVLRVLREEFPGASITASDVGRDAVDFCERTFGASGVYSSTDPREIRFEDEFDLIWVGSVFTHIDETGWDGLLPVLAATLADDGLLIFTTEGPAIADKLREGELDLGLERDAVQSIYRDFAESGFGYGNYPKRERHDYPSSGRYGVSVVHPDQVRTLVQAAGLQVVHYISTGWDNHQDVFACRLAASMSRQRPLAAAAMITEVVGQTPRGVESSKAAAGTGWPSAAGCACPSGAVRRPPTVVEIHRETTTGRLFPTASSKKEQGVLPLPLLSTWSSARRIGSRP